MTIQSKNAGPRSSKQHRHDDMRRQDETLVKRRRVQTNFDLASRKLEEKWEVGHSDGGRDALGLYAGLFTGVGVLLLLFAQFALK